MKKNCKNRILVESLLEWTLGSKTTFIDATENKELEEKLKKLNIFLPNRDLAAFSTIYCKVNEYNKNGVIIKKEVAEVGVKTLIGRQVNWNHEGAHQIAGYLIDAYVKNDYVCVDGILFKSLFINEFDQVIEMFSKGQLHVSFELWTKNEKNESIIKDLGNGKKELTEFIGHGCALLLIDQETGKPIPPACPQAQVLKLLASEKVIEEAEQIIDKVFEKDNRLIYAELIAIEEQEPCTRCKTCTCFEKEDKNIMAEEIKIEEILEDDYEGGEIEDAKKLTTEQRNALPDSDFALIQEKDGKKIRRFPINDEAHVRNALARLPQAKDISEEEKKSALAKILKKAKELNMTELLKKYEKAEEVKVEEPKKEEVKIEELKAEEAQVTPEPVQVADPAPVVEQKPDEQAQVAEQPVTEIKLVKEVTQESVITTYTPKEDGSGNTSERKGERKTTRYYSDGKEEVSTVEYTFVDTYSLAQEELLAAMPKEVSDCVKNKIKDGAKPTEAVKTCWDEYKKSQGEAMATVAGEKDTEITNLKTELAAKAQEIVELTKPKVEVATVEKPELDVGNVEKAKDDKYKKIHDEVNERAFGKKKDKK
jgi:hypothetical protein